MGAARIVGVIIEAIGLILLVGGLLFLAFVVANTSVAMSRAPPLAAVAALAWRSAWIIVAAVLISVLGIVLVWLGEKIEELE